MSCANSLQIHHMTFFSSFFQTNEKLKSNQSIRCEKHKSYLKQITYSNSALQAKGIMNMYYLVI